MLVSAERVGGKSQRWPQSAQSPCCGISAGAAGAGGTWGGLCLFVGRHHLRSNSALPPPPPPRFLRWPINSDSPLSSKMARKE